MPHVRLPLGRAIEYSSGRRLLHSTAQHRSPDPLTADRLTPRVLRQRPTVGNVVLQRLDGRDEPARTKTGSEKDLASRRHALSIGQSILGAELADRRYSLDIATRRPEQSRDYTGPWLDDRLLQLRALSLRHSLLGDGNGSLQLNNYLRKWRSVHDVRFKALEILSKGFNLIHDGNASLGRTHAFPKVLTDDFSDILSLHDMLETRPSLVQRKRLLRTFNALVPRLQGNKDLNRESALQYGLLLAAEAHNPAALNYYANELVKIAGRSQNLSSVLLSIRRWTREDLFEGSDGQQRRQELKAVLVGSEDHQLEIDSTRAFQWLCSGLSTSVIGNYLGVLAALDASNAIVRVWTAICRRDHWQSIQSNFRIRKLSEDRSTNDKLQQQISGYQTLLHDVVQHLLIAGAPKLAWAVVNNLEPDLPGPLPETWSLLLDHPDYIQEVPKNISEHLIRKYEEHVDKIETALGIEWTGGEEGFHKLIDGDDTSAADSLSRELSEDSPY